MYNPDTDFIFPSRVIPEIRDLRGPDWQAMVDEAQTDDQMSVEHLSFILMMVRHNGCESCNADSYRAMRGCTACSIQTIERAQESDRDFVKKYQKARRDVEKHFGSR